MPDPRSLFQLKMILIKCCDISNEVRPMEVAEPWVDCLLEEYFMQVSVPHPPAPPATQLNAFTGSVLERRRVYPGGLVEWVTDNSSSLQEALTAGAHPR